MYLIPRNMRRHETVKTTKNEIILCFRLAFNKTGEKPGKKLPTQYELWFQNFDFFPPFFAVFTIKTEFYGQFPVKQN